MLQIVVAPAEEHWQTFLSAKSDASLTGEIKAPLSSFAPLQLDARKIIAHRCMLAIKKPQALVNLGVGMPEVDEDNLSIADAHLKMFAGPTRSLMH